MDVGLGHLQVSSRIDFLSVVLILVLVDVGLGQYCGALSFAVLGVLILVLVDVGLGQY